MRQNIMNMTTGSPLRHILRFTIPLLIGNLFQQLYNMVDSLVVGNFVGANALAAVGACASMNFLFTSLSTGLSVGIGVIVSQYFGADDESHVRVTIANSIYVLSATAILISILGIFTSPILLRFLNTPEVILQDSIIYMRTTCLGLIVVAVYNGVASILRALGDSRTPLYFLIVACILNILLDLLFVLQFEMSVFGVAFATVIAQAVAATAAIIYAIRKNPFFKLNRESLRPNFPIIIESFRLGLPLAFQCSLIAVSCTALQGIVNSFGEKVVAAFTITSRIEHIVQQPFDSLALALTTYCGQNIGARKIDRIKQGYKSSIRMVFIFSMILLPIAYILGESIVGAFVKETDVIEIGTKALRITSLCYFGLGMVYVPRAVLNGCGDAKFAMISGITEIICRIGLSQLLIRIPFFGYWAVWLTTGATWLITATVCLIRYTKGKWKTMGIHS